MTADAEERRHDPWILPFEARLKMLKRRSTRVAYFYDKPDNSTFRYRVYNPVSVLNRLDSGISASFFFRDDHPSFLRILEAADMLVVSRSKYTHELNELIARFRAQGKQVLYDIDDLVFDVRYAPLVAETIGVDLTEDRGWDVWFAYVSRHGAALQLCDACITTNRHLAARLSQYAGLPVRLMRNFMNEEQLRMSERVRARRRQEDAGPLPRREKIHVGYFSGTPTHARDFNVAKPGLIEMMKRDSRVHLLVVGYMTVDGIDESIRSRIRHHPFTDFVNLQNVVGSVDVNIVPLLHNDFTDCKSELKFFEAAAVLTPSIATPTATYRDCIRHGDNGLLAGAHQWRDSLERLFNDETLYERLVREGERTALSLYAWNTRLQEVLEALGLADPPSHSPALPVRDPLVISG